MNNILIITESRTVAKTIAQALGANVLHKGYFGKGQIAVTWTGGGIISSRPKCKFQFTVSSDMTADETFAANFDFSVRKDSKGKGNRRASEKDEAQIGVIQRLWRNAATIVNAMKPSAPGEVIFTSLSNYIGIDRPVVRMWLTSITRKEIVASLENGGNPPEYYGEFHDNAIAEHTIGRAHRTRLCRAGTLAGTVVHGGPQSRSPDTMGLGAGENSRGSVCPL